MRRLQVLQLDLDQVRQLQVVEEQIEELVLGQREGEIVLALAVGTALAAASASAALRFGNLVADLVLLVARQHVVALARVAPEAEGGLAQALGADRDLLGALGLGDLARLERILDRLANLGLARDAGKRWRLPRLLAFGLRRRSTICICSTRWAMPPAVLRTRFSAAEVPPAARGQDLAIRRARPARGDQLDFLTRMYHSTRRRTCRGV